MAVDQAQFQQLLSSLMSMDNDVRQQAEEAYNILPREVKVTHLLGNIHNGQQSEETRQMAAVLLRRLFTSDFNEFYKQENIWKYFKYALRHGTTDEQLEILIAIKNAVIGSNRQKGILITNELVPDILNIAASSKPAELNLKLNALIILGSLARGSKEQIQTLVNSYNVLPILVSEIFQQNNNKKHIEICLSTMREICEATEVPLEDVFGNDTNALVYFLNLSSAESSLKSQICVMCILVTLCKTYEDQMRLLNAGTINALARMVCIHNEHIQEPALRCLTCMCYGNRAVADTFCVTSFHGKSLPDILNRLMSRLYMPEIQLTAAKCLTNVYRAGTLPPTDNRIMRTTLPTLTRLCSDNYELMIRASAAKTLAYLTEFDTELQQTAAISSHLIKSLMQLLQTIDRYAHQFALECFASLAANDEAIRKCIMEDSFLIEAIVNIFDGSNSDLKLAALKCLHSLSRSVQQLRTTFQDFNIWKLLMDLLLSFDRSSENTTVKSETETPPIDVLVSATSIICNLLLEFSPSKEPLFHAGIIEKLCKYLDHEEYAIRLNSVWSLMNMSFNAEAIVKTNILQVLTTNKLMQLLRSVDKAILMKSLGLTRNLLSTPEHVDIIMNSNSKEILDIIYTILDSNQTSDVKEQVLCIIGNIVSEVENVDYIINDERILKYLGKFLINSETKLQAGALFALNNILHRKDFAFKARFSRLSELNVINNLYELNKSLKNRTLCKDYIYITLCEILNHCKAFCPDNFDNIVAVDSSSSSSNYNDFSSDRMFK